MSWVSAWQCCAFCLSLLLKLNFANWDLIKHLYPFIWLPQMNLQVFWGAVIKSSLRLVQSLVLLNAPNLKKGKPCVSWLLENTKCKEAGEPAHKQLDACKVTKVNDPGVMSWVNNGAYLVEVPRASFLGWMNTATANSLKAERYPALR